MIFLRKRILLVSSWLVTVMMLIGVGVVSHDALTIRAAEEVEEDTSKLLLHTEQWLNHQEEIEVAYRNFLLSGRQQDLDVIAENRQASAEHIQGMRNTLSEYHEDAEEQLKGLLKFTERHQQTVDRIISSAKSGDASGAALAIASQEARLFIYGAKLIIDNVTHTLQDKRSLYNSIVSLNVLRGSVSFALLALVMISAIWVGYFVTIRAQRKNEELTAQLAFEATHDALTGLPNRRYICEHLNHTLDLAKRHKLCLGLLVIDLDGFKTINDTYGHDAGDRVLKEVARRFKQVSRTSDFVARTGGDEFALAAENIEPVSPLQHLAQRLIECLAEPIELGDKSKVAVGCSIGVAIYPDHANNLESLLIVADQAMYAAKESGKNSWRMPGPLA